MTDVVDPRGEDYSGVPAMQNLENQGIIMPVVSRVEILVSSTSDDARCL